MTETLCTCTDQNCTAAHDIETGEKAPYKFWFKGEYSETVAFADTPAEVVSEISGFTTDTPEELGQWQVKDRRTNKTVAATKFFAQCAA